jgi:hypothetical protein
MIILTLNFLNIYENPSKELFAKAINVSKNIMIS